MRRMVLIAVAVFVLCMATPAHALLIDVTNSALTHFGDFPHVNAPGDFSNISKDWAVANGDFGWHYSPSNHGSAIGGILLDQSFAVTSLSLQVHANPFREFLLQGSTDTTTGVDDGSWATLLTATVTERTELAIQSWDFTNSTAYSAYRINILSDYTPAGHGWAMYRWELLADDNSSTNAVPEPATLVLFGAGLTGMAFRKKRRA